MATNQTLVAFFQVPATGVEYRLLRHVERDRSGRAMLVFTATRRLPNVDTSTDLWRETSAMNEPSIVFVSETTMREFWERVEQDMEWNV